MNYIDTILSEVQTIVNSYNRATKMSGKNFNLFSLLRKEREEVRLHSKFISELLNPQGSHQQGSLFLDCFLEILNIQGFETKNAYSETEYYIGVINKEKTSGGSIDILIRSANNSLIKIENKIDAGEQDNQLLRYQHYNKNGYLIFLTLDGKQSENHKTLEDKNIKYKQISYKKDIVEWLEKCIKEIATVPIIRESILQYLYLVKKITNQNINQKMNKEIVTKITRNEETFKAYLTLCNTADDIYLDITEKHLIPFFNDFATKNELIIKDLNESLITRREQYSGFYFTDKCLSKYGLRLSIQFMKSLNRDMYYGLSFERENPTEHAIIYENIENEAKKVMDKPNPRNSWWLCNTFWKEYKNWGDINTLYNLSYGNFQKEFTAKLEAILKMAYSVIDNYNENS